MLPFCYIFMNKDNQKNIPRHTLCTTLRFKKNLLWFILKYVGSSLDKIIHIVIEFYNLFFFNLFCVTSKTDTQLERLTALITKRPPQTQLTCAWKVKQPFVTFAVQGEGKPLLFFELSHESSRTIRCFVKTISVISPSTALSAYS